MNIAIVGIGNCASSLYQGLQYYKKYGNVPGLINDRVGKYSLNDINMVLAYDVDYRKVGKTLKRAIVSEPNCTPLYMDINHIDEGPVVKMGNVLDGISNAVRDGMGVKQPDCNITSDIKNDLIKNNVDILINYLPVGSQKATEYYAEVCLETGVSFLNCIPIFIASDPTWSRRFKEKGIPIIGDDMKSQFGASIVSQVLQELAVTRGINVKAHIQRNIGGNSDFLNMSDTTRLASKKTSKENVIRDKIDTINTFVHAGPSEYISYHEDNKIADIHMDMEGFLGSKIKLDLKLSVIDSPNSAGIVCDAVRYLKIARDMGMSGALCGPSAFTQKTPPCEMTFAESIEECEKLSNTQK